MGQKNNDRVRIRNRRYKIKRFLAQPKNDVNRMVEQLEEWQLEDKQSIQALDVGENINCLRPYKNIKYLYKKFILTAKTLKFPLPTRYRTETLKTGWEEKFVCL